jgi:hypothetical protein
MSRITIGPFIVPATLRDSLLSECEETGAPQGEIVRRAIKSYLKGRKQRGSVEPESTDTNRLTQLNSSHKE